MGLREEDIQVCVLPTSDGAGVRMMTFAGDRRVLDEASIADGSRTIVDEDRCTGWRESRWSRDDARVFRVTELTCEGKGAQRTSGISTMTGIAEWLDLQVVEVEGQESLRVRRYVRSAQAPPRLIEQDIRALDTTQTSPQRSVTAADVVEASRVVSPRAVEAWLVESKSHVQVNRHTLGTLADADVPKPVIDLLVALAYPKHFEIRTHGGSSSFGSFSDFDDFGFWSDPWGVAFDPYAYYYSPFAFYRSGYDPYYLTLGGFVPITGTTTPASPSGRGHVVNGAGYTQVETRQPPPAARTQSGDSNNDSSGTSSQGNGSSSSSGSSGGSASPAGYSSGGSSAGQTAVPR
jgi:uncharacterized membrane protein YgcG